MTLPFARLLAILLIAPLVLALPLVAQAKTRWYQVEVIVFRHADPSTAEEAVPPAVMPDYLGALSLMSDLPEFDDDMDSPPHEEKIPGPTAFKSLPESELRIGGVYRRLRDLSAYEPVLHIGWRQPGGGGRESREVYITDKPRPLTDSPLDVTALDAAVERRVEGTVRVRTGRLLHVEADFLNYSEASPVRINERRKVKFKELHYFDNPFFGVIVQVTPYRFEDPEAPAENATTSP